MGKSKTISLEIARKTEAVRIGEMSDERERAEFEKWFSKAWPECSLEWYTPANRYYFGTYTQPAWEAWQAARHMNWRKRVQAFLSGQEIKK